MSDLHPLVAYEDDPVGDTVHHPYSAYNQGWDAREDGHPLSTNPYQSGSREEHWWALGWTECDDDYPPSDEPAPPPSTAKPARRRRLSPTPHQSHEESE